jgi:hypothetical protein
MTLSMKSMRAAERRRRQIVTPCPARPALAWIVHRQECPANLLEVRICKVDRRTCSIAQSDDAPRADASARGCYQERSRPRRELRVRRRPPQNRLLITMRLKAYETRRFFRCGRRGASIREALETELGRCHRKAKLVREQGKSGFYSQNVRSRKTRWLGILRERGPYRLACSCGENELEAALARVPQPADAASHSCNARVSMPEIGERPELRGGSKRRERTQACRTLHRKNGRFVAQIAHRGGRVGGGLERCVRAGRRQKYLERFRIQAPYREVDEHVALSVERQRIPNAPWRHPVDPTRREQRNKRSCARAMHPDAMHEAEIEQRGCRSAADRLAKNVAIVPAQCAQVERSLERHHVASVSHRMCEFGRHGRASSV